MGEDRHFLDTSVARHLLTAAAFYKRYLDSEIGPGPAVGHRNLAY